MVPHFVALRPLSHHLALRYSTVHMNVAVSTAYVRGGFDPKLMSVCFLVCVSGRVGLVLAGRQVGLRLLSLYRQEFVLHRRSRKVLQWKGNDQCIALARSVTWPCRSRRCCNVDLTRELTHIVSKIKSLWELSRCVWFSCMIPHLFEVRAEKTKKEREQSEK